MRARRVPCSTGSEMILLVFVLLLTACSPAAARAEPAPTPETPTGVPTATDRPDPTLPPTPILSKDLSPAGANSPTRVTDGLTAGPLSVRIAAPADGAVVSSAQVDLTGEADPETVMSVDDDILVVDSDRKFTLLLHLEEGPNILEITASDPNGNQETVYWTVIYDPQP